MEIRLKSKHFSFQIDCSGKYNFILGDSGSNKTHFVKAMMKYKSGVRQFSCNVSSDGYKITKDMIHVYLGNEDITTAVLNDIKTSKGHLYIIDEFSQLFKIRDISSVIRDSKSYFIFITRKVFGRLPVSVDSLYILSNVNGVITNMPLYANKNIDLVRISNIEYVLTEDSKSGRQFFELAFPKLKVCSKEVIDGDKKKSRDNSQLHNFLLEDSVKYNEILVVFDASAYGFYYPFLVETINKIRNYCDVSVISWDSFEAYLLEKFDIHVNKESLGCVFESIEQCATFEFSKLFKYDKSSLPSEIRRDIDNYVYGILQPLVKYGSSNKTSGEPIVGISAFNN